MTPARRRAFSSEHPTRQRFTKTDLAKFENTWDQLPHMVSLGAQKNFSDYTIRLGERDQMVADRAHFERLIAKAILFRTTERIVQRQNFGGYRANIVTYTIALLSHATGQRVNLDRIWRAQALSENLQVAIAELSHEVHRIITNPPSSRNITEWCKSERCWAGVRDSASRDPLRHIGAELLGAAATRDEQKLSISNLPSDYVQNLRRLVRVSPGGGQCSPSGRRKRNRSTPPSGSLPYGSAGRSNGGRDIRAQDAELAVGVLDRAAALGFPVEAGAEEPTPGDDRLRP